MKIFYLQMRSFHEAPGWRHLVGDLFAHLPDVSVITYKDKNSPAEGATCIDCAKILNRRYPANFLVRYVYECILIIRAGFYSKYWKGADCCLVHSFPSMFLCVWLAKFVYRKKVAYWIQDLWPDNAAWLGALRRGGLLYRIFAMLERYAYRKADAIITISDDIKARLQELGAPGHKISVVHNWGHGDDPPDIAWADNLFVKKYGLSADKFYAVYAGHVGSAQNVDLITNAAAKLYQRDDIRFLILSTGAGFEQLKARCAGVKNVEFLPLEPVDMAYHVYSAASVNLITLKKGVVYTALPSKTASVLACNRPLIACVDKASRYAALLREYGGLVADTDNAQELADTIISIADRKKPLDIRGRECFNSHFSSASAFEKFDKIFRGL